MNKFTTGKGYHYGLCLPVIGVWNQLGLDRIIGRYLSSKVKIPVSRIRSNRHKWLLKSP